MTRFWITLEQGVRFVMRCAEQMRGGEVFVPKIPSMRITDLAAAVAPECRIDYTGIRPGEKLHELLLSEDEARNSREYDDMYVIRPMFPWFTTDGWQDGCDLSEGFRYSSDTNAAWVTAEQLQEMIKG